MARLEIGVVDVFLLRGAADSLAVLVLRRAPGTRCTGAWETIHGRINDGEAPEAAAVREVAEETGLVVSRLYNVICQPFYLHRERAVQMAVVFAAFIDDPKPVALGAEHDAWKWLAPDDAIALLSWPRSISALRDVLHLLRSGDAGSVEDVLRVV